ncbi:YolD-like family protein [Bacillus pumilus]|uniref:YolD-like family protein n=1 Tax=Bacillus pumilus TaxID=1408 RepID=UPI003DA6974D
MLPEHVAQLKHDLAETKKTDKPIIDEQQIEEFEVNNRLCNKCKQANFNLMYTVIYQNPHQPLSVTEITM